MRIQDKNQNSLVTFARSQAMFARSQATFANQIRTVCRTGSYIRRPRLQATFAGNIRTFVRCHVALYRKRNSTSVEKRIPFYKSSKKNRVLKAIYPFILYFLYLCLSHSISIIYLTYYQFHYNIIHRKH